MTQPESILLVEDSDADYEAMIRALRKTGPLRPLYRCADGDEALDYLHRRGRYADVARSPRPRLILLDLNLPGTDGHEVLRAIKGDAALRHLPVIVLSTSSAERDIAACYAEGANSYIVKPVGFDNLLRTVQHLADYWFDLVLVPRGP